MGLSCGAHRQEYYRHAFATCCLRFANEIAATVDQKALYLATAHASAPSQSNSLPPLMCGSGYQWMRGDGSLFAIKPKRPSTPLPVVFFWGTPAWGVLDYAVHTFFVSRILVNMNVPPVYHPVCVVLGSFFIDKVPCGPCFSMVRWPRGNWHVAMTRFSWTRQASVSFCDKSPLSAPSNCCSFCTRLVYPP